MKKGIAVIICTFNGAAKLPQTLAHLAAQLYDPGLNWEIIIVDNASTDNSAEISAIEWEKYNLQNVPLKVVAESRPGKINALETGNAFTDLEYFIICDDDNWLAPDYVQKAFNLLDKNRTIGAVGGQSFAVNDSGIYPDWFTEHQAKFAVGTQGDIVGDVTSRGYLWGAGLATRTLLYRAIYKDFPTLLIGPDGKPLPAGEDNEYCQRVVLSGYRLFYNPTLAFQHYIPQNRLEIAYRDALITRIAEAGEILFKYRIITKAKVSIQKNSLNWLRLLIITAFRALFSSGKKRRYQINTLRYILHLPFKNDPDLNKIRDYERSN